MLNIYNVKFISSNLKQDDKNNLVGTMVRSRRPLAVRGSNFENHFHATNTMCKQSLEFLNVKAVTFAFQRTNS